MHKKNPKYKLWRKRHLEKIARHRNRHSKHYWKKKRKNNAHSSRLNRSDKDKKQNVFTATAPQRFSIKDNSQEMVSFFNKVLEFTNTAAENSIVFFDLSQIEYISVDAIIYLLAVIKDLQKIGLTRHSFFGNLPQQEAAKNIFVQSGFLNYVNSKCEVETNSTNQIQIVSNNHYDQRVTKNICDFVCQSEHCEKVQTRFLYVLLNEMMLNTYQHAYEAQGNQTNSWYLYVQNVSNKIRFTFLDTGLGIPSTAKKKWHERLFRKKDTEILESALNGEFRTKTGQVYRGKGLPKIKECVNSHHLDVMYIISNNAYYVLRNNGILEHEKQEMEQSLRGTIYYWELEMKEAL